MEIVITRCDVAPMTPRPVPDDLIDSWQSMLSQWTNKRAHDALLGRAMQHDQLAWLACCYREAAVDNPDDPIARDCLEGVERAATMRAFAAGTNA